MKQHLKNQYQASLGMLKRCIEQYNENVWLDAETYTNAAWHIAYHTIFFANIYCCPREQDIVPWPNEA